MKSQAWQIKENASTYDDVVSHLQRCDDSFSPALSSRVSVTAYSRKLVDFAARFEAWSENHLIALLAAYYLPEERTVFVSNVSVDPDFQQHGIAAKLFDYAIGTINPSEFDFVRLEVGVENHRAQHLYTKLGFWCEDQLNQIARWVLKINPGITTRGDS